MTAGDGPTQERSRLLVILERHPAGVVALSALAVVLLLAMHYTATLHRLGVHDALRRLFYLPVLLAAIAAGSRGGLGVATLAVLGFLPHLRQLATLDARVTDSAVELVLLLVVGGLVGEFADASRRARAQAAERGRLAAVGEMGLSLMSQTEGPLSAIEGQADTLAALAGPSGSRSVEFAAQVIREEVFRARQLLGDMGEIARIGQLRHDRVELLPLLERIVRDVTNARTDGRRAMLIDRPRACAVESDRRALAFGLRTLVFGLLDSVPPPGWLEIRVEERPGEPPTVELGAFSLGDALPELEEGLTRVFGAGAKEYRFQQVLCVRLLISLGASVRFQRVSPCHARILVGLPAFPAHLRTGSEAHGGERRGAHPALPQSALLRH